MKRISNTIRGFTWVRNAVIDNPELSSADIMVYMTLMRYMNNRTKDCFPAIKTIMKQARLGQRTVYKCLAKLEALELISANRNKGRINRYTILEPPREEY